MRKPFSIYIYDQKGENSDFCNKITVRDTLPLCLLPETLFHVLQYQELLVASYNNNEDAPHEPDGVALVWNMKFKKTTPEYVFHCQVLEPQPSCKAVQVVTDLRCRPLVTTIMQSSSQKRITFSGTSHVNTHIVISTDSAHPHY